jgi:hypothetical protein
MIRDFERHHPHIKIFLITHPKKRGMSTTTFDQMNLQCGDEINVLDRTITANASWYWDAQQVLSILNEE